MTTAHKIKLVSDRVARAKALLLSQFKDSPNINLFLEALVEEVQELENTIIDLQEVRTLSGSYGWWLDRIGEELKVSRGNYSDSDYKTAIKIAMAKKTSSATEQDILRLVYLLTADTSAVINNDYPYFMELVGFLFCVSDSQEGLAALADLFPVNTRIRLVKQHGKSFKFGTVGRGFGSGSTLNDLVYHRYGNTDDTRFTTVADAVIPPPMTTAPYNILVPSISGAGEQGQTLILYKGEWGGDDPLTYTYQWLRDNDNISGETGLTYVIGASDLGKSISCRVTASNTYGNSSVVSNTVLVSETVPADPLLVDNLGLPAEVYSSASNEYPTVMSNTIIFKSDGTLDIDSDGSITSGAWLNNTGVGAGDNYTVTYHTISGNDLDRFQNVQYPLTGDVDFEQIGTLSGFQVISGQYEFTIRNINDGSVVESATLYMILENEV